MGMLATCPVCEAADVELIKTGEAVVMGRHRVPGTRFWCPQSGSPPMAATAWHESPRT